MSDPLRVPAAPAPQPEAPDGSAASSRLPASQLLLYAFPSIGTHFTFMLMGLYFFKFATDVLRIEPAVFGALFGLSRLWDAVSDPVAGYLSDRTRTRFGRRRPWMAAAALPFGLSMVMLWSPPASLSGGFTAAWIGVGLLLFYTTYTALMVPYGALGAELSQDYHDRTRLFAYRYGVGAVGLLLGIGAYYLLLEAEDPATAVWGIGSRELGRLVAWASLLLVCATVAVLVARLREREDYLDRGPERVFGAFGDVWRNPHARPLLGVQALHFFSTVTLSMVAAFMFRHVMQIPSAMTAIFVGCFAMGTLAAVPLWTRLSGRFGKDRCWRAALLLVGSLYGAMFLALRNGMPTESYALVVSGFVSALLGAAQSSNFVLSHSMQADVIDWDELRTGERKEGAYLATWSFVEKCAGAMAAVIIGGALQLVGYEPDAEQSAATRTTILGLMSLLPAGCHFGAAYLLGTFALDETEHRRIRTDLDARRDAGPGRAP